MNQSRQSNNIRLEATNPIRLIENDNIYTAQPYLHCIQDFSKLKARWNELVSQHVAYLYDMMA